MTSSRDLKSSEKENNEEVGNADRTRVHIPNFTDVLIFWCLREVNSPNHLVSPKIRINISLGKGRWTSVNIPPHFMRVTLQFTSLPVTSTVSLNNCHSCLCNPCDWDVNSCQGNVSSSFPLLMGLWTKKIWHWTYPQHNSSDVTLVYVPALHLFPSKGWCTIRMIWRKNKLPTSRKHLLSLSSCISQLEKASLVLDGKKKRPGCLRRSPTCPAVQQPGKPQYPTCPGKWLPNAFQGLGTSHR